jgi:hypothetical protein
VLDPKFSPDSGVKISNDSCESCYKMSVCEARYEICLQDLPEASLAAKFLFARLVRSDSHESRYEISVCKTHEKRVLLLILNRKSCENFGSE